jgi:preprotein translocase subunit SecF
MFDITSKRTIFLIISEALVLIGVIALLVFGLKPGVEFSSGSEMTVSFEQEVEISELKATMVELGHTNAIVRSTGGGDFIIRTEELSAETKAALEDGLIAKFGAFDEQGFYSVGKPIAASTQHNAIIAVGVAAVGILLYITWAFRKMPKPFHYGVCAIIALVHDVVVVLGVFSILGAIMGWEIDLMFITGVLAVIGYSINNTVVIFDRIRENLKRGISFNFEAVVNHSLVETMSRSVNTSFTTMLVVLALLLFVGSTIINFAIVLAIGIIAGTYSSLFLAPNLLVVWDKGEWGRLILLPQAKAKEV